MCFYKINNKIITLSFFSTCCIRIRFKSILYCFYKLKNIKITDYVTPKGDHWLSQHYSELYLNTLSKPLCWLSKKCRRRDLNSQPQRPLPGSIPSLMLQTARFYARLYYHAQTWAHNLLRQKVITDWVSAIVSYILTDYLHCFTFVIILTYFENYVISTLLK